MKIAIFSELFYPYVLGGGENRYYQIAKRLAKKHEVHVFTMKLKNERSYEEIDGIFVHRIGILKHPLDKRSLMPLPFYLTSSLFQNIRNFDVIDCNTYFPCIAGFLKSRLNKIPIVATIHDVYLNMWGESLGNRMLQPIGRFIEKIVCSLPYDKIITVSSSTKKLLMRYFSVQEERIEIIPNGIDIKLIDSVKAKKIKNQICYVGRLVPHKHVEDLILAIEKLRKDIPDIRCKIVGGGILKENLEAMIKEKKLENNVKILGYMKDYKDVIRIMKESEVFVLPSTREGFGIVMLEAMRCKAVPVAYKLEAYKDFCNEKNSILVRERNVEGLVESIKKLLIDDKLRKKMSEEGYNTSREFSWGEIVLKVEKTYKELLQ
ncbi:MAG: glycosyltransferase family 4 protein [Candidatus Aenigmatarchaeota archaeon]